MKKMKDALPEVYVMRQTDKRTLSGRIKITKARIASDSRQENIRQYKSNLMPVNNLFALREINR